MVCGFGFGVQGFGCNGSRARCCGSRDSGVGCREQDIGCRVQGVEGLEFRFRTLGFRDSGLEFAIARLQVRQHLGGVCMQEEIKPEEPQPELAP